MIIRVTEAETHNQLLKYTPATSGLRGTSVPALVFCFTLALAKNNRLHCGPLARRYERGSKMNRTSHVLDLRHVVERLSALKYVGSLYLTSFVPGAK